MKLWTASSVRLDNPSLPMFSSGIGSPFPQAGYEFLQLQLFMHKSDMVTGSMLNWGRRERQKIGGLMFVMKTDVTLEYLSAVGFGLFFRTVSWCVEDA